MKTILVTDKPEKWVFAQEFATIISAVDYLKDKYSNEQGSFRVINLCESYQYQKLGYYVSLIATARDHKVFPTVVAIQDIKSTTLFSSISDSIRDEIQEALSQIKSKEFVLSVYFGKNIAKKYNPIARKLHGLFPMPLFRVYFQHKKKWVISKISAIGIDEINEAHRDFFEEAAKAYFEKKRFYLHRKKNFYFDMAVLVNPKEKTPPSSSVAIKKFIEAAERYEINAQVVEKEEIRFIAEYDALFIRETTSVNHHTYQISRRAAAEGLVVMDSPSAIVKCSNKVHLAELMHKHHIKTPKTVILSKLNWQNQVLDMTFPCVLKLPDSAFSKGVIKIDSVEDLEGHVKEFFKQSDLIVAQDFMPSDYDWRIGVLDNEPLFACHYFMAKDHWQIYNWDSNEEESCEGDSRAIPLDEVPSLVLQTALKASKLIGNELYGIDLKQIKNDIYVIEMNDNPSIDHGVEDAILGDELYNKVMKSFQTRLKKSYGEK